MTFAVSVIVAVYNAVPYLEEAVHSALAERETGEIILVDDGSADGSLTICEQLAATHEIVRLFRHPEGQNRGPSASRNLGIVRSRCDYITFLDADDYYLPGRFRRAAAIFAVQDNVDGVYEAVGTVFEDAASEARWHAQSARGALTTLSQVVEPERLLEVLTAGTSGHFSMIGLTVRRSLFEKTGLFDVPLRLHQDTVMHRKMAAVGRLVPGDLHEPVAMRRIHPANRSSARRPWHQVLVSRTRAYATIWRWARQHLDVEQRYLILDEFLRAIATFGPKPGTRLLANLAARGKLGLLALFYPVLLSESEYWKRLLSPGLTRGGR